jgi:HAD superfamily hydrolase (TIGR01484 family)
MDLDGTLIDRDGVLSDRDRQAMDRAVAAGVALAIVTGRRRSTFRAERARLTGLAFRSSVSNGAVLLAGDNETIERVHPISWQSVQAVWAALPENAARACLAVTVPGALDNEQPEQPDAIIMMPDGRFYHAASPFEPEMQSASEEFLLADHAVIARPLVHAAFHVVDQEMAEPVAETASRCFGEDATVYVTRPPRAVGVMVEIVAPGGKGLAVRDLAASFDVPDDAIAAIGDELNDVPLLRAARFRYAMGGSRLAAHDPDAVEVAVADGVADALERFIREIA